MTNPAFLKLTKKEQVKAIRLRKLHRRERVAAGQAKSAQLKQRVANKKEAGIVTRKMDRHWKCGCVVRHVKDNVWEQVIVCTAHANQKAKFSVETISAEEVNKKLAEQAK